MMSIIEVLAGIPLIIAPLWLSSKLVGLTTMDAATMTIARITGVALTTLGAFCWLFRRSDQARTVAKAMLFYNAFVVLLLLYSKFELGVMGNGLVPALIVHFAISVWILFTLQVPSKRSSA